ncbi:hypothetical protein D3C75_604490 [compost metagenome]
MLLCTQQVTRTANRQISHRYFETRAQLRKFLNRLQTFLCNLCQNLVPLIREISVSDPIGPAYTSTQLIELRQAHFIRIMHNKCINVRNIYARLNNTCADEHIVFSVKEIENGLLQLRFRHLTMSDANSSLRNKHRDLSSHFLNALHTIIEIIDLTTAG